MSSERDVDFQMVQILDQTDRHQDMVDLMKQIIELNPVLSAEERNMLSVSYKNLITVKRNGIRSLALWLESRGREERMVRIEHIKKLRETIIEELDKCCLELIALVDEKLMPHAQDAEAKLFYEKLKADYYRYIAENKIGEEDKGFAEKAKEAYEKAVAIASAEIPTYKPSYLSLILNYSVYLYDIAGQKEEAIKLAQKTFEEGSQTVEGNNENDLQEAKAILGLLQDNVRLWTQPEGEGAENPAE